MTHEYKAIGWAFLENGIWMGCPIVHHMVSVEGLALRIEVAVNLKDKTNILSINYFDGVNYVVDS